MTEQGPVAEQLPVDPSQLPVNPIAGNEVDVKFTQVSPMVWTGRANCKHGVTENATYLIAPGTPPLNHAQMVQYAYTQHDQLVGCDCPREVPKVNSTVTFTTATAVVPGEQRYIPQQSASIAGPARPDLRFGPPLTCVKAGAYLVQAKVQLAGAVLQGAGVVIVQGVPVVSVPMALESGKATANIVALLNLTPNQSIQVGYENFSTTNQDVALTTLTVSEVFVP